MGLNQSQKWGIGLMLFIGLLYVSACGLVFSQQRKIIFKPSRVITQTPVSLNLKFEEVRIPVHRGDPRSPKLHGWWIPAQSSQGTLLYLHGNGLNIEANLGLAKRFRDLGLSVLLIDYRGYGLSDGDFPRESWVYEDAEAAWQFLTQTQQIDPRSLFIFGHSLGGAIAIDLAQHHPEAAGLIVQSTFSSMASLAKTQGWPNAFPLNILLTERFDSRSKVPKLKMPKLWMHGSDDRLIPAAMSQDLHQLSSSPSQIQIVEGAGHNNVAEIAGDRYDAMILRFLQSTHGWQATFPSTSHSHGYSSHTKLPLN